jgi:hypothetical protein
MVVGVITMLGIALGEGGGGAGTGGPVTVMGGTLDIKLRTSRNSTKTPAFLVREGRRRQGARFNAVLSCL